MLNCKMSSADATDNIVSECYVNMWGNDPTPSKLETGDIMDLIQPNISSHESSSGPVPESGGGGPEASATSPSTIIHHTGSVGGGESGAHSPYQPNTISVIVPSTSPTTSSSPPSSSSSQYLASLPSLTDSYCTTETECHLLDGFHAGVEPPFHKLSETCHPFRDGGYDAFISDLQQPTHHHHNTIKHSQAHNPTHPLQHSQEHHPGPSSHPHGGGNPLMSPIDSGNSVLLLDVSQHHHQSQHSHPQMHDGPCSSGCPCTIHAYAFGGDGTPTLDLCHRNPVGLDQPLGQSHHYNHHLHHHLHHHHHHQDYTSAWDDIPCESTAYSTLFQKGESPTTSDSVSYTDNDTESKSSGGSFSRVNDIVHVSPPKRKVGRPPKKDKKLKRNEKKTGRLWEFIRDLLKNPEYCPSLVKWENHEEGHFRFVNSEKVAQLWGQIKNNPRMTYEKLSRAMRYYYKSHVFEPVLGRRLVYKFGYNATNWKPINPNFASSPQKMYN